MNEYFYQLWDIFVCDCCNEPLFFEFDMSLIKSTRLKNIICKGFQIISHFHSFIFNAEQTNTIKFQENATSNYIWIDQSIFIKKNTKYPLAPMGVLAPGSPLGPPSTLAEIFYRTCLHKSPSNISPNPSEVISEVSEA